MVIAAISITDDVQAILSENHHLHVLHCFEHVWNLIDKENRVLSIVTPKIGNAPFNLLVDRDFLPHLPVNAKIDCCPSQIITPQMTIDMQDASYWNATLSPQNPSQVKKIVRVCKQALAQTNSRSLFSCQSQSRTERILQDQLKQGADALIHALQYLEESALRNAIQSLAGTGIGLTPSGDDWLMGCIIALYQLEQQALAQQIATIAAQHTTDLSANLLRMAGQGKVSELWHHLLTAHNPLQIQIALSIILNQGYSSSADAIHGFVAVLDR